jgi:hypothetical protein
MDSSVIILYTYTMRNDQIRIISISTSLNIYHFFVLEVYKLPPPVLYKIYHKFVNYSHSTEQ